MAGIVSFGHRLIRLRNWGESAHRVQEFGIVILFITFAEGQIKALSFAMQDRDHFIYTDHPRVIPIAR